eukprot:scaffold109460_cov73-Attheya_sp.AAC.1
MTYTVGYFGVATELRALTMYRYVPRTKRTGTQFPVPPPAANLGYYVGFLQKTYQRSHKK